MTIRLNKIIFYVSYFFFLLYAFFGTIGQYETLLKNSTNISIIIIAFYFFIQIRELSIKELLFNMTLIIIFFIYAINSNNLLLLKLFLISLSVKNISFEERISYDFKLRIILMMIMLILHNFGITEDTIAYFNGEIRHSLGFTNPNVLGMHIYIMIVEFIYLKRKEFNIYMAFGCLVVFFILNEYPKSRSVNVICLILLILLLFYKYKPGFIQNRYIKFIIVNSPLITTILVLLVSYLYINKYNVGLLINDLTSGRLSNIEYFYNNYLINFFGNNIEIANKSLDTMIAYVTYAFGISGIIIYLIGIKALLIRLYELKDYFMLLIMFVFIIYGMSEKLWLFADCNIFITTLSLVFFKSEVIKFKKENSNV